MSLSVRTEGQSQPPDLRFQENAEERLHIFGGRRLRGEIRVSGAKNSAIALMPAALLGDSPSVIENVPRITDVSRYITLLHLLGAEIACCENTVTIDPQRVTSAALDGEPVRAMRASYYLMGALLGRFHEAHVGMPGGCDLGPRPIDQHLKGFEALGAEVEVQGGLVHLQARELHGARIYLDVVSVGATINLLLAAARADGQTIIENAAREPEVVDLANFLCAMGAQIRGAGTDTIRIQGVPHLHGASYSCIPDRIEAGTYMIAAAATKGRLRISGVIPTHLDPLIAKLREIGVRVEEHGDALLVDGSYPGQHAVDIKTQPYPGFPTDLQQPMTAYLAIVPGTSIITDTIYESRFRHVNELKRMGADIRVQGRTAVVEGVPQLTGAAVTVSDLRAGAALLVAGLEAEGETIVDGLIYLDRGYEHFEEKLAAVGAQLLRK